MYSIESFINYVYEDEYDYATEGLKDIGKGIWEGVKKFLRKVKEFFTISIPNFFKRIFGKNPELKKDPEVQKAIKEVQQSQNETKQLVNKTENNIKKAETTKDNDTKEETKQEIKKDTNRIRSFLGKAKFACSIISTKAKDGYRKAKEKGKNAIDKMDNAILNKTHRGNLRYTYDNKKEEQKIKGDSPKRRAWKNAEDAYLKEKDPIKRKKLEKEVSKKFKEFLESDEKDIL